MSKLLPTRLPISLNRSVTADVYNRLVRILELNLATVDLDNARQTSTTERDEEAPVAGTLLFNTNTNTLQCWDGHQWRDCFTSQFYATSNGYSATASLGTVTVTITQRYIYGKESKKWWQNMCKG